jgi:hypothetical protein
LKTLEYLQREMRNYSPCEDFEVQLKKPELHIHKFVTINIAKNEIRLIDDTTFSDIKDFFS